MDREVQMTEARHELDWDEQFRLSLYGDHARKIHERDGETETCSMCGQDGERAVRDEWEETDEKQMKILSERRFRSMGFYYHVYGQLIRKYQKDFKKNCSERIQYRIVL